MAIFGLLDDPMILYCPLGKYIFQIDKDYVIDVLQHYFVHYKTVDFNA